MPDELTIEERAENAATWQHINVVRGSLSMCAQRLRIRGDHHDRSKLFRPEVTMFTKMNAKAPLNNLVYGSPEYQKVLREMLGQALHHHYEHNDHHPEYFGPKGEGWKKMDLFQMTEMLCDWEAAGRRHKDGNILHSIHINQGRFGYDFTFRRLLENTAASLFNLDLSAQYYAIVGTTGIVFGKCGRDGMEDVLAEEPDAEFVWISEEEFRAGEGSALDTQMAARVQDEFLKR
jgi:hypothetical protein